MSSDAENPKWSSEDPQRWSRNWAAYYQIGNAEAVLVDNYCRNEAAAKQKAFEGLEAALKKAAELGLSLEGECWTVHWQTRNQTRRFDKSNQQQLVSARMQGRVQVALPSVAAEYGWKGKPADASN